MKVSIAAASVVVQGFIRNRILLEGGNDQS